MNTTPGRQSRVRTVTIVLDDPIKHGEQTLTELTLRSPTIGELMMLDDAKGEVGKTIYTICACSGLPPSVISQLYVWDSAKIGEVAEELMGELPATGARPAAG